MARTSEVNAHFLCSH